MKKHIRLLVLLLAAPMFLASCLDDDDTETDDYCYISAFSLGTIKRAVFTITTDGEDSTYTTSFSGSLYPMTIDQINLTIENKDSLPVRSIVSKVLASVTFDGVLAWRKADISELGEDTLWTTFSSSDSIDFTEPLHFACIASNGKSYRTYTVNVNVHQQLGDTTSWERATDGDFSALGARKAVLWNDQIVVLGENSNGSLTYVQHPLGLTGDWVTVSTTGTDSADITTLQKRESALYLSTSDGKVIESTNAVDWTTSDYPQAEGLRLVAATEDRLYALLDGALVSSDGGEWTAESLDDDASYLPDEQTFAFNYTTDSGMNRLMLVGQRSQYEDDLTCMVWAKSWKTDEEGSTWTFYVPNGADKRRLPAMDKNLNVVAYDDGFLSFGEATRDGQYTALDSVLHSVDHGIAWVPYENDDMLVDTLMQQAAEEADHIVSVVDDDQFLWMIIDDQVWRGRINRLGFLRQDP